MTSSGANTSSSEPTTGEPVIDCPFPQGGAEDAPFRGDIDFEITPSPPLCQDLVAEGLLPPLPSWLVHLSYPALEDGTGDENKEEAWQPGRKPLVVFEHGSGGQNFLEYDHIFAPLAREGFIGVSIRGGAGSNANARAARILCTARWFASEWPQRNARLNCDLAFMGHSAGGQGAVLAARYRGLQPGDPANLLDLEALVAIAPRGSGVGTFLPEQTAPFLTIQGGRDEDVPGGSVFLFDALSPEVGDEQNFGKALVWAYDVDHDAFGGGGSIENDAEIGSEAAMRAKGEALATEYIVPFLRWRVLNEDSDALRKLFTGDAVPDALAEPSWWDYLPDPSGAPVVFTAFTVDERRLGEKRRLIDTFRRAVPQDLSPAEPSGATVLVSPPELAAQVQVGAASPLAQRANPENHAMRVDWSVTEGLAPVRVTWEFTAGLDLAGFSFLSVRAANILQIPDSSCQPIEPDGAVDFQITLSDAVNDVSVLTSTLIPQDFGVVNFKGQTFCSYFHFFRTLRIPLDDFCQQGPLDLTGIRRITLTFGAPGAAPTGALLVDGLEFTASDFDADAAPTCM